VPGIELWRAARQRVGPVPSGLHTDDGDPLPKESDTLHLERRDRVHRVADQ
jgi:hypothetical protein